jgi:cytidine deaminase
MRLPPNDDELIARARAAVNPRRLSPMVEAGSVACALVSDTGSVHLGVCIDVPSGIGFCAEHSAIASMITSGESRIVTIVAVNWDGALLAPCGRCREFIRQVHPQNGGTRVLLARGVKTVAELLPDFWGEESVAISK